MEHADITLMLRCNPLFGGLDPPLLGVLARLCTMRTLPARATLFRRGDPGDCLYGVRAGQLQIEITADDGQRITLASLGAGDLFGEIALLDGKGRTADAIADAEEVRLFVLRRADLLALIAREPAVGIKLIELLCQRLRAVSDQLERNMTQRLEVRLAVRVLQLAEDFGMDVAITQDQLARSVNATRESVNRQLRQWEEAGLLRLRRGGMLIADAGALRDIQPEYIQPG